MNCQSLYYSKAEKPNSFPVFHILYNFFFPLFFLHRGWDIGCLLIVESASRSVGCTLKVEISLSFLVEGKYQNLQSLENALTSLYNTYSLDIASVFFSSLYLM